MNRKVPFALGEYYHIYNRGVEKRDIFLDTKDKTRFQKGIFFLNTPQSLDLRVVQKKNLSDFDRPETLVSIGAYCLMPNHFHILVKETEERGISKFMAKLMTSYSKYFNTKYERVGPLFQGRFKAEHVDNDEYLKYLFAYIHLNPVKLIEPKWKESGIINHFKAERYLCNYQYSSYSDCIGMQREENLILTKDVFPEYFLSEREFKDFINDWLTFVKNT